VRKPDGIENCHLLSDKNVSELSFAGSLLERGKSVSRLLFFAKFKAKSLLIKLKNGAS
jgi:hypothetical protein